MAGLWGEVGAGGQKDGARLREGSDRERARVKARERPGVGGAGGASEPGEKRREKIEQEAVGRLRGGRSAGWGEAGG